MSGNVTPLPLYAIMANAGKTLPFTFSIKQQELSLNPSEISKGTF